MTLDPKKRKTVPKFHVVRIGTEAFAKLHDRKIDAMRKGSITTVNEIANKIIMEAV